MRYLTLLLTLGVVDYIGTAYVLTELSKPDGSIEMKEFPVEIFPCEISEGDFFYFDIVDGVTEIRCGEPPV